MKKLLFIFALLLTLTGCAKPPAETFGTIPTPPTIPAEKSPFQILSDALEQTRAADSFRLEYRSNGEVIATQSVTSGESFQPAAELIRNPDFLSDFCAMGLHAIPSNTGITRYEITDLTATELSALLGTEISAEDLCSVALEVDGKGYLIGFEYQAGSLSGSITACDIHSD